jgi:hypothetical protein
MVIDLQDARIIAQLCALASWPELVGPLVATGISPSELLHAMAAAKTVGCRPIIYRSERN